MKMASCCFILKSVDIGPPGNSDVFVKTHLILSLGFAPIFNKMGRLNDSNPVAHPLVKHYLKFVRQEQAGLAITPTQAVPLFFD